MWSVALIIAVFAGMVWLEMRILWEKRQFREMCAFLPLWCAAFGLSLAVRFRLPLPNPTVWISFVFKPVSKLLDKLFLGS